MKKGKISMKKSKLTAFVLSAAVMLSTVTASADTTIGTNDRFTDIKNHWSRNIVNEAATLGIVGGYPEGYFLPENLMKREEFFKLITNVLTEKPDISTVTLNYYDVKADEWYVPTIKTIVGAKIALGNGYGSMGIGQIITREEAAKIVATIVSKNNLDVSKNSQSAKDAKQISEWARPYVDIMFQKGYMQGDTDGNFRPKTALTRAEAATLLLNVKKHETVLKGAEQASAIKPTDTVQTVPPAGNAGCQKIHSITEGAFTAGVGTKKDPYIISTEKQLNHVRKHLGEGAYFQLDRDIKITQDLAESKEKPVIGKTDWSEGNFEPIGWEEEVFDGIFDGNGHTISGLNISGTQKGSKEGANYAGLFGYIGTKGVVTDLTIDNSTVKGDAYVGGIAGYNAGEIANCTLGTGGRVKGGSQVGGVAGLSNTKIDSSLNKGTVEGTVTNIGGIVGYMNSVGDVLTNCTNKGTVKGNSKVGGIAGYVMAGSSTIGISDCTNSGEISSSATFAGGIIGQCDGTSYGVTIENCSNSGTLSGDGGSGGILGYAKGSKISIEECVNTGNISGANAGGIACGSEGTVIYCYNTGNVTANSEAGGIVGYQNTGEALIRKCYNDGKVIASSNAGGIAGYSRYKILDCYNTGKVKAGTGVGGIVGKNGAPVQRCYNVGEISGNGGIGAIAGRNMAKITDCFYLAGTAESSVGIEGSGAAEITVKSYAKEHMTGQTKVKLGDGYQLLTTYLNDKAGEKIWAYTYGGAKEAGNETGTVISNGGGVVPPLVLSGSDPKGNTISTYDLERSYLYPELVEMKRK